MLFPVFKGCLCVRRSFFGSMSDRAVNGLSGYFRWLTLLWFCFLWYDTINAI